MAYDVPNNAGLNVSVDYQGNSEGRYNTQMPSSNLYEIPLICGRPVPIVSNFSAMAVLILNIFLPGWGTMLVGIAPQKRSENCCGDCCCFFWLGWLHFILWPILVGWILAIILGCQLVAVSAMEAEAEAMYGEKKIGSSVTSIGSAVA